MEKRILRPRACEFHFQRLASLVVYIIERVITFAAQSEHAGNSAAFARNLFPPSWYYDMFIYLVPVNEASFLSLRAII